MPDAGDMVALSESVMVGTSLVISVPAGTVAVITVPFIVASTAGLRAAKLNLVMSLTELLVTGVGEGVILSLQDQAVISPRINKQEMRRGKLVGVFILIVVKRIAMIRF